MTSTFHEPAGTHVPAAPTEKTTEERKQLLAQAIQREVGRGARVESQGDYQAVLVRGHRPNHLLHLILSVFTIGFWLIIWIGLAVFGGEKRRILVVDGYGNVTTQR